MPQLVAALDPSKNPEFLNTASLIISLQSEETELRSRIISSSRRMDAWTIHRTDSPEVRDRKIDLMRSWWKEHGGESHRWWRVWSSSCR